MRLAERHFPLPDAETCGGEVSLTFSSLVALNTRKWTRARLDVGLADGLVVVLPVRIELTTSPLPRLQASPRIYFTALNFWPISDLLGADLVPHAAMPALSEGANWEAWRGAERSTIRSGFPRPSFIRQIRPRLGG